MEVLQKNQVISKWKKLGPNEGVLRDLPQKGKPSDQPRDFARFARPPGKRISKNGKIYWETRKNRSDIQGSRL